MHWVRNKYNLTLLKSHIMYVSGVAERQIQYSLDTNNIELTEKTRKYYAQFHIP